MEDDGIKVWLYVYDLSGGLAASLSTAFLGKQIDGIWHTSLVLGETEFYFGGGINTARPGTTVYGQPVKRINLGVTHLPMDVVHDLVNDLRPRFTENTYSLLSNNCNNFTDELSKLLLGKGIPEDIVKLPEEVMSTPFGQMIQPMLTGLENQLRATHEPPPPQLPAVAPTPSTSTPQRPTVDVKAEMEAAIRQEFTALVAEGGVTPNQAAVLALEKVRKIYGEPQDKSQAS